MSTIGCLPFKVIGVTLFVVLWMATPVVQGEVIIDWVTVGDPRNPSDPDTTFGRVDYVYRIGKYEVTNAQYAGFLNAIAATDTHELYTGRITRSGSPGSYVYAPMPGYANRPVTLVSFWHAARFANWLHNGQPTGQQDASTTEDGAYTIGVEYWPDQMITRNSGAKVWIPSNDEWYKAAHHKNDGPTANYWDYPTGSDTPPSNKLIDPDPGNNANFHDPELDRYTVGPPFWTTEVGAFENSMSAYGTFDQGGNVAEWTDTPDYLRFIWGGRWGERVEYMSSLGWHGLGIFDWIPADTTTNYVGFRVASIPEPATSALLVVGAMTLLLWRIARQWR